jgi:hypothetical protein
MRMQPKPAAQQKVTLRKRDVSDRFLVKTDPDTYCMPTPPTLHCRSDAPPFVGVENAWLPPQLELSHELPLQLLVSKLKLIPTL